MTEPRRLLDDPAALSDLLGGDGALGRELLDVGRDDRGPSTAMKSQMWSGIQVALGPLAGVGAGAVAASSGATGAAATGTAATGTGATAAAAVAAPTIAATTAAPVALPVAGFAIGTKVGLAGIVIGGSLVTAGVLRTSSTEEAPPPPAAIEVQAPAAERPAPTGWSLRSDGAPGAKPEAPAAAEEPEAPKDEGPKADAPHAATDPAAPASKAEGHARAEARVPKANAEPSTSSSASSASNLVAEAAGVQKARESLAQGNASRALTLLAELDKSIPRGALGQERAVLAIEALSASGQKGQAAQRAKAFLAANPSSPYAERVRAHAQ